jgi:hypothetical protein
MYSDFWRTNFEADTNSGAPIHSLNLNCNPVAEIFEKWFG